MLGAIIGDVVGSVYEHHQIKTTDFPLFQSRSCFTDDTVLTIAVAEAILHGTGYAEAIKAYGQRYPDAGYGRFFYEVDLCRRQQTVSQLGKRIGHAGESRRAGVFLY